MARAGSRLESPASRSKSLPPRRQPLRSAWRSSKTLLFAELQEEASRSAAPRRSVDPRESLDATLLFSPMSEVRPRTRSRTRRWTVRPGVPPAWRWRQAAVRRSTSDEGGGEPRWLREAQRELSDEPRWLREAEQAQVQEGLMLQAAAHVAAHIKLEPPVPHSATDVYRAQYRDLSAEVAWAELVEAKEALELVRAVSMPACDGGPTGSSASSLDTPTGDASASAATTPREARAATRSGMGRARRRAASAHPRLPATSRAPLAIASTDPCSQRVPSDQRKPSVASVASAAVRAAEAARAAAIAAMAAAAAVAVHRPGAAADAGAVGGTAEVVVAGRFPLDAAAMAEGSRRSVGRSGGVERGRSVGSARGVEQRQGPAVEGGPEGGGAEGGALGDAEGGAEGGHDNSVEERVGQMVDLLKGRGRLAEHAESMHARLCQMLAMPAPRSPRDHAAGDPATSDHTASKGRGDEGAANVGEGGEGGACAVPERATSEAPRGTLYVSSDGTGSASDGEASLLAVHPSRRLEGGNLVVATAPRGRFPDSPASEIAASEIAASEAAGSEADAAGEVDALLGVGDEPCWLQDAADDLRSADGSDRQPRWLRDAVGRIASETAGFAWQPSAPQEPPPPPLPLPPPSPSPFASPPPAAVTAAREDEVEGEAEAADAPKTDAWDATTRSVSAAANAIGEAVRTASTAASAASSVLWQLTSSPADAVKHDVSHAVDTFAEQRGYQLEPLRLDWSNAYSAVL